MEEARRDFLTCGFCVERLILGWGIVSSVVFCVDGIYVLLDFDLDNFMLDCEAFTFSDVARVNSNLDGSTGPFNFSLVSLCWLFPTKSDW